VTPLRRRRLQLGMAQQALAQAAGISRQALSALEAGRSLPSLPVALSLARILDEPVERLFPDPQAAPPEVWVGPPAADGRVAWTQLGDRVLLKAAPPGQPADARDGPEGIAPLAHAPRPRDTLWLGGCDPGLPLLAQALGRLLPDRRVRVWPMTTAAAVAALARGELHLVSTHRPVRAGSPPLPAGAVCLPYARWDEGLVFAGPRPPRPGAGTRWALRPRGATARSWAEEVCRSLGSPPPQGPLAEDHWQVAQRIAAGESDLGVAVEAAARAYGLSFAPLGEERVDLLVHPTAVELAGAVAQASRDPGLWEQLTAMGGYRQP
jgi:putative molybdopterin biosynthesis protein